MDKVFSTRLDLQVIGELERTTRKAGITKKKFLEEAILAHARLVSAEGSSDSWSDSFGAWKRRESVETTLRKGRSSFQKSMERHKRP